MSFFQCAEMPMLGEEEGYGFEDIAPSVSEDNWYEDLGDASDLDTSPHSGLLSPLGPATKESSSFTREVRRAVQGP